MNSARASRLGLRTIALGYIGALLVLPVGLVFYRTFEHGLAPAWDAVTTPEAQHAFWLTLVMVAIAVPANTIFGVGMALVIARGRVPGKSFLSALIDLPFKTEVASVFVFGQIESDRATTAAAVSVLLLVISFLLLLGFAALSARGTRHEQR